MNCPSSTVAMAMYKRLVRLFVRAVDEEARDLLLLDLPLPLSLLSGVRVCPRFGGVVFGWRDLQRLSGWRKGSQILEFLSIFGFLRQIQYSLFFPFLVEGVPAVIHWTEVSWDHWDATLEKL